MKHPASFSGYQYSKKEDSIVKKAQKQKTYPSTRVLSYFTTI
jgi:hypothetical protein